VMRAAELPPAKIVQGAYAADGRVGSAKGKPTYGDQQRAGSEQLRFILVGCREQQDREK